jgi:phage replication O-like protein O
MKISPPNYTQTPNDLFDRWLPHLGEAELKVLLVIMRKTFGWHKKRDRISITQLSDITGLLRETVISATKSLQSKGMIIKDVIGPIGKQETHYELVITEDSNNSYQSVKPTPLVGLDPLGSTDSQKKASYTKETAAKEKETAAAFSKQTNSKKNKKSTEDHIYECLIDLDLIRSEKIQLTRLNIEKRMIEAVKLSKSKKIPPDNLAGFLHWASTNAIKCPEPIEDTTKENKEHAEHVKKKFSHSSIFIETLSKGIEFVFYGVQKDPIVINYSERDFKQKLENCIKTLCFKEIK